MLTILYFLAFVILLCCGKFKIALIILGVTLAVDILILLLRVGARLTLDGGGLTLRVIAGPVRLKLLPAGEEKAKKPKKPKKPKKEEPEKREPPAPEKEKKKPKIKITFELVSTVLKAVGELLGRLRRKISIDRLVLHYTVAAADPADAAMTFGYASAGVNALMPVIENIFKVKERDVGAAVTFDTDQSEIFVDAQLTLAIWEILYIVLAVWPPVKALIGQLIKNGKVDKNGQASDQ